MRALLSKLQFNKLLRHHIDSLSIFNHGPKCGDGEVDITEFDITESDVTFFQEIDITESDVTKKGN